MNAGVVRVGELGPCVGCEREPVIQDKIGDAPHIAGYFRVTRVSVQQLQGGECHRKLVASQTSRVMTRAPDLMLIEIRDAVGAIAQAFPETPDAFDDTVIGYRGLRRRPWNDPAGRIGLDFVIAQRFRLEGQSQQQE